MFNMDGEVIGINTAIYSPSGGSVGIGFAVPSNTANSVIAQLKDKGRVTRGWLGVSIQGITPSIAKSLGLSSEQPAGALVAAGISKPMPTEPPEGEKMAVLTPITLPCVSKVGPPELPRLIGASIWM